jgi:hypothetical protein
LEDADTAGGVASDPSSEVEDVETESVWGDEGEADVVDLESREA